MPRCLGLPLLTKVTKNRSVCDKISVSKAGHLLFEFNRVPLEVKGAILFPMHQKRLVNRCNVDLDQVLIIFDPPQLLFVNLVALLVLRQKRLTELAAIIHLAGIVTDLSLWSVALIEPSFHELLLCLDRCRIRNVQVA